MDVTYLRETIPACQRTIYMNTGWSGPSPIPVVEAVKERMEYECYQGPTCREVLDSAEELFLKTKEKVAGLLNVRTSEIALTQNTTEGLNIALNGFPWREGDEIITFDIEHASVLTPCFYTRLRHGASVKVVPLSTNDDWADILTKVADALTDRTRMIVFSHIQYSCGLRMPVEAIRKLISSREVYMLVDGAQTPGHIALDIPRLGVDFYSIPAHKWLLGPDGIGALYIREELISTIQPSYVAYGALDSLEEPIDFQTNAFSMDKFRLTTTSAPLAAGLSAALDFIGEIGPDKIESRNREQATSLKAAIGEVPGVKILSPFDGPGVTGLTSFQIDGLEPAQVVDHLWQERKIVGRAVRKPASIRLATDFFNTDQEIGTVAETLQSLRD